MPASPWGAGACAFMRSARPCIQVIGGIFDSGVARVDDNGGGGGEIRRREGCRPLRRLYHFADKVTGPLKRRLRPF